MSLVDRLVLRLFGPPRGKHVAGRPLPYPVSVPASPSPSAEPAVEAAPALPAPRPPGATDAVVDPGVEMIFANGASARISDSATVHRFKAAADQLISGR